MKLKINKACDLSSISVLPPHSRRTSAMNFGTRSQSQQSFSQGLAMSQLSQNSFDENLVSDQTFDSQERDKAMKGPSLAPARATRDESQSQLGSTSHNFSRRWGSSSVIENKCQVSEEVGHKYRLMETSLNRLVMVLDSVRSDVMQVNRAVKEVSMETEGVRQKMAHLDNSMQQVVKEEEALKAFLDARLKSISDQMKEPDQNKLNEISLTLAVLPRQIEAHLSKFQNEVCMIVTKKVEVLANGIKSINNSRPDPVQSPKGKCCITTGQSQKSQIQQIQVPMLPPSSYKRRDPVLQTSENPQALKPKITGGRDSVPKIAENPHALKQKITGSKFKKEEVLIKPQEKDFRVIISDEESDDGFSLLPIKETGKTSYLIEEVREETVRILMKARKRKRKQSNCVILD